MKSLSNFGLIKTGVCVKAILISSKDLLASIVHLIVESFFYMLFSNLISSAKFVINILRTFILPKNACSSLMFLGCCICKMASILAGSIQIPSLEIMWPKNFPSSNPNKYFLGFREIPYFLHLVKTCLRWSRCWWSYLENIVISSRYITRKSWISLAKAMCIAHWKVAPVFFNPKGIFTYMNVPQGVVKVVLAWSLGWTKIWLLLENPSNNEILVDPTTLCKIWSILGRG